MSALGAILLSVATSTATLTECETMRARLLHAGESLLTQRDTCRVRLDTCREAVLALQAAPSPPPCPDVPLSLPAPETPDSGPSRGTWWGRVAIAGVVGVALGAITAGVAAIVYR
jgi:hypothetical protein